VKANEELAFQQYYIHYRFIYINDRSINIGNVPVILVVRKFWLSELAGKFKSIFTVWKGTKLVSERSGKVGGIIRG